MVWLKNADFMIGNSSAGIREAPIYGVPAINVGSWQNQRYAGKGVTSISFNKVDILSAVSSARKSFSDHESAHFGDGRSAELFVKCLRKADVWAVSKQKIFNDIGSL